jgi:hypothetical protein
MVVLALSAMLLLLATQPAGASNAVSLGYSEETTIVGPGTDACASGTLIYNHDGSFENGYAWQYAGHEPPYYGALGEAYNLGRGAISCAAYWLTALAGFDVYPADCYVWDGGVGSAPGAVLAVTSGVYFQTVPGWPTVGQNDIDMNLDVSGAFTVGFWSLREDAMYFCAADENGPRGHPWTCIAPGIGYPSGWQDPAVVWPNAKSMGCGVYFEQGTPVESETWGAIKAMFRR